MNCKLGVFYRLKLIPKKSVFDKLFLWLPMPYEQEYKVAGKVDFRPEAVKIATEEKFGNKMAYFEFKKKEVGRSLVITQAFEIERTGKKAEVSDFTVDDYEKDKEYKKFVKADRYIESDLPVLKKVAREISGGRKNLLPVVRDFYEYILSILTYGYPIFGLYTASQAYGARVVDCGGFATLFCAFCRISGVPAREVSGFMAKSARNSGYHAWSEFMLPGKTWLPVDLALAKLKGKDCFGWLASDRIVFCKGTDFDLVPKLPDDEKAAILQIYYLRFDKGAKINDFKVDIDLVVKKRKPSFL